MLLVYTDDDFETSSSFSSPPDVVLTSDVWHRLSADIHGEIAVQLPSCKELELTSIIRHSEICRHWRRLLSPHIFHKITLRIDRDVLERTTIAQSDVREELALADDVTHGGEILRKFAQFLDDNQSSSRSIVPHIKHLVFSDGACRESDLHSLGWRDRADLKRNAELLVDVMSHFRQLNKLEIQTLIPLDGFRIAELMLQGQAIESMHTAHPRTPIDIDELIMVFWDDNLPLPLFDNSIPHFFGLLALFGNVKSLDVYDNMRDVSQFPDYGTLPAYNTLPALPHYLRLSKLEFFGVCSRPRIIQMIVSPSATGELSYFDIDIIIFIVDLPIDLAPASPPLIDLIAKRRARLQETTLQLEFCSLNTESDGGVERSRTHGHMVKAASKILSTLNAPHTAHSVRKINIIIYGITHHCSAVVSTTGFFQPFHELDSLLFDLRNSAHQIQTTITPRERYPAYSLGPRNYMMRRLRRLRAYSSAFSHLYVVFCHPLDINTVQARYDASRPRIDPGVPHIILIPEFSGLPSVIICIHGKGRSKGTVPPSVSNVYKEPWHSRSTHESFIIMLAKGVYSESLIRFHFRAVHLQFMPWFRYSERLNELHNSACTMAYTVSDWADEWRNFLDDLKFWWSLIGGIESFVVSILIYLLGAAGQNQDTRTQTIGISSIMSASCGAIYSFVYVWKVGRIRKDDQVWRSKLASASTFKRELVSAIMAAPLVWLAWSIILLTVAFLSYIWDIPPDGSSEPPSATTFPYAHRVWLTVLPIVLVLQFLLSAFQFTAVFEPSGSPPLPLYTQAIANVDYDTVVGVPTVHHIIQFPSPQLLPPPPVSPPLSSVVHIASPYDTSQSARVGDNLQPTPIFDPAVAPRIFQYPRSTPSIPRPPLIHRVNQHTLLRSLGLGNTTQPGDASTVLPQTSRTSETESKLANQEYSEIQLQRTISDYTVEYRPEDLQIHLHTKFLSAAVNSVQLLTHDRQKLQDTFSPARSHRSGLLAPYAENKVLVSDEGYDAGASIQWILSSRILRRESGFQGPRGIAREFKTPQVRAVTVH
ncbi:hypothetical protein NM688_g4772 [Phlebia brevispora]|uniref:Uncharacterized protein n=1 Tax=Phlebia brevispora TaxID=194682 RepID=A0ACC1T1P2_9APHY|nr:hypothetical protein NM688_g4772 [Phlebia brevispora]